VSVLKAFLRILGWTILILALCAGVYFGCHLLGYDQRTGVAAILVLLALILAIVIARRMVLRRRRQRLVSQVATLDSAKVRDDTQRRNLVDNRWNRAMSILRTSYLGRTGNPIYALPWTLVMGRTGAGKSSAIGNSGLSAMFTDVGPDPEHPGTRNCDWHFFQKSVVIDTAGRYAIPQEEGADTGEWREFLLQLAKYRRREPLNGLVIAVAADTLHGDGKHMLEEAGCLRRRVDEVMRILGAKFPVYIMVTKLDLLPGMTQVLEGLSQDEVKRCMGVVLQSPDAKELVPISVQVRRAMTDLAARFRSLCLFEGSGTTVPTAHRLLAWEEFRATLPALSTYVEVLFADNPYQESPLLRGIYFSSALRSDVQVQSHAFPALSDVVRNRPSLQANVGGIFLRDFFSEVLPTDRNLNRPIAEYLRWNSAVRTVAYAALLLATFGLSALIFLSYAHIGELLHRMHFPVVAESGAGPEARLLAFERLFRSTERAEKDIAASPIPSLGMDQGKKALVIFSDRLNSAFEQQVLLQTDRGMELKRSRITGATPDGEVFTLASDLVWRYDLANAALHRKSFEDMLSIPAMPQGMLDALNIGNMPVLPPAAAYCMARYYHNIASPALLEQKLASMRASLGLLPTLKDNSLHWLVHRAGRLSDFPPLTGGVFWPGRIGQTLDEIRLAPEYTTEGFNATIEYLKELSLIVDKKDIERPSQDFLRWYARQYVDNWSAFVNKFTSKLQSTATARNIQDGVPYIASAHNPYFALAMRMEKELRTVIPYTDPKIVWMDELSIFTEALRISSSAQKDVPSVTGSNMRGPATDATKGILSPGGPIRQRFDKIFSDIGENIDTNLKERNERAKLLAKEVDTYLDSLKQIVPYTFDTGLAYSAIKAAIPNNANMDALKTPLNQSIEAYLSLPRTLGISLSYNTPVKKLAVGPLQFLLLRLVNDSACNIQDQWEGKVLASAGAVPAIQLQQALFGEPGGLVRDFVDKTLDNFIVRTINGYQPDKINDLPIPFTNDFLQFLNAGVMEYKPMPDEYSLELKAVPVDVNDDAIERPQAVTLSLSCLNDKQNLVNYMSPASHVFNWKRKSCGDTKIVINFKSTSLVVNYDGEQGFIRFLHDFQYGSKTFTPADFPGQAAILEKLGITDITLRYEFTGAEPLLLASDYASGSLPFVVTQCRR
jgi:type VI secretion system protein ImpL